MSAAALFDLLPDFGTHPPRAERHAPPAPSADAPVQAPPAPVDVDALIAQAVAEAEAALEERLAGEHREELDRQRQADAAEATAFLESLGGDMGAAIATGLEAMERRLTASVGDAVARILGGVLGDELRARALEALARTISETAADADAVGIRVSGPVSLYEPLKAKLGAHADNLQFSEAPGFDLTLSIDDAVFESRMSEWSAALSEVMS